MTLTKFKAELDYQLAFPFWKTAFLPLTFLPCLRSTLAWSYGVEFRAKVRIKIKDKTYSYLSLCVRFFTLNEHTKPSKLVYNRKSVIEHGWSVVSWSQFLYSWPVTLNWTKNKNAFHIFYWPSDIFPLSYDNLTELEQSNWTKWWPPSTLPYLQPRWHQDVREGLG